MRRRGSGGKDNARLLLLLVEHHDRQQAVSREVEQRVPHALVDEPAGAAVGPQPLDLVGDPDHAPTPGLDVYEVGTAADVGERVVFAAVVRAFALVQAFHVAEQLEEPAAAWMHPSGWRSRRWPADAAVTATAGQA